MNLYLLKDRDLLRTHAYIDGQWCGAARGQTISVYDRATGDLLGHVPNMGQDETGQAIAAADAALQDWFAMLAEERSALLQRWNDLILQHVGDLAIIMAAEQGKPLLEARTEVIHAASYLELYAEEAKSIHGDIIPAPMAGCHVQVTRELFGVRDAMTPWNFPAAVITRKIGPALATGCTVVVKPPELTPFGALALAELAHRAGMPKGVLNVVTGGTTEIGAELTSCRFPAYCRHRFSA